MLPKITPAWFDLSETHPTWSAYWLWQYSDGQSGQKPRNVPGIGFCGCNHFAGAPQDLIVSWMS